MHPEKIINYIRAYKINTKISHGGYCQGLSSMARDAFLLGADEYQRYNNRLGYMRQDNFLNQMTAFIKQAQLLTTDDIKIGAIPSEELNQWPLLIAYAAVSLEKPESKINAKDLYAIYLETRAFLETMTIFLSPDFHRTLFARKTYIPQTDTETVLPLMSNYLAEQHGKICEVNKFIGLYSNETMIDYLRNISNIQTEKRFALMLSRCGHIITLLYDKDTKIWTLDNHGHQFAYVNSEMGLAALSQKLANSLSKNKKNYPVSTHIYSLGNDQEEIAHVFSSFCKKKIVIAPDTSEQALTDLFYLAVQNDHIDAVTDLLKHPKCNPNVKSLQSGSTALHLAAHNSHLDVVNTLLLHACEANIKNDTGCIALHLAAYAGHLDVVNALLLHGSEINIKNDTGCTALHLAALSGHLDVVNALLLHGSEKNSKNKTGCTTLHLAARNGHIAVVKALLAHSACNLNEKNNEGRTARQIAMQNKHFEIVQAIDEKSNSYFYPSLNLVDTLFSNSFSAVRQQENDPPPNKRNKLIA